MSLATPTMLAIGLAAGLVVASVRLPDVYAAPIQSITLYRGPASTGPWTQVDARSLSLFSRWQNVFDTAPLTGQQSFYYAALDNGNASTPIAYTPQASPPPIIAASGISSAAYGTYPLLGSDVYLNPATGEAVIGPNGDMLAVNGLDLLAQDLRIRFMTEKGELLLHPDFGLAKNRIIGGGQASPQAQAQLLQTLIVDACLGDPRVDTVVSVVVQESAIDAWVVTVTVIAIGSEGPTDLNIVYPYFLAGS